MIYIVNYGQQQLNFLSIKPTQNVDIHITIAIILN